MKQYCQYHPATPAHWYCDACNKALCPQCVDVRDMEGVHQGEKLHMCPNCNLPARWLGVANIIDPFWTRIPRFFLYPLSIRPLALLLILSLIMALLLRPGVIGALSQAVIWGIALKYAYAILQSTASGDLTAPPLDSPTLFENIGPVVKQVGIYIAIFLATGVVFTRIGIVAGGFFLFFATLFLPAMIILLVTTESLVAAINPMMFVSLAWRIGWGYLLMYFFYSILGGAPALLGQHIIQHLPPPLQVFLFSLVKLYYTFISYHLMGYVILQYHEEIGYSVNVEDFRDAETDSHQAALAADTPEERLLRRVNQMVKDGDHNGARILIGQETRQEPIADPVLSDRYYTLLKMTAMTDKMVAHGRQHIDLIVQQGDKMAALDVYRECLAKDPGFAPGSGSLFKVGTWLNESGNHKSAIGAFNRLTKAYPQDPLVPKAYFRAAQIFNERLRNPEKAHSILNALIQKYPDHDLIPYVRRYLGQME